MYGKHTDIKCGFIVGYVWVYKVGPTWAAHVGPKKIVHVTRVGPMKKLTLCMKTSKLNEGSLLPMYGCIRWGPPGQPIWAL